MKLLFRLFLFLVLSIFVLAVILALALMVLKPQIDQEIGKLLLQSKNRSVQIDFLDYGKPRLTWNGIKTGPIRARGVTRIKHPYFEPREFDVTIKQARILLEGFNRKSFQVTAKITEMNAVGGRILNEDKKGHERLESVSKFNFQTSLRLGHPFSWRAQILKKAREFKDWAFAAQPIQGLSAQGVAVFIVDDWPITVHFRSVENQNGDVHLEGQPEDLRVIAEMIEVKFTDSDVQLAAKNLLKTPLILKIRRDAEARAIKLKGRDPEISYDIPRHIFWSYWLAKAFGGEFAREATNAHETGDALNSATESEKDRHQNALGIEYAKRNLSEAEVEKLIFTDPRVSRIKKKPAASSGARAKPDAA